MLERAACCQGKVAGKAGATTKGRGKGLGRLSGVIAAMPAALR